MTIMRTERRICPACNPGPEHLTLPGGLKRLRHPARGTGRDDRGGTCRTCGGKGEVHVRAPRRMLGARE